MDMFPYAKARGGTLAALVVAAGCLSSPVFAGEINVQNGAAISGYDPVAFFTENRPVEGSPANSFSYKGATFHFVSAGNREAFASDPERYAPQFGGFCAYGTSQGYKAKIDPAAFTIAGGKLYLNYDKNVQATWRGAMASYIAKAEENWPSVKTQ